MNSKRDIKLTSIPERNENEEEKKWVPKKKHEVLKAKYKCLKKLFQIYDASVIGILPETYATSEVLEEEVRNKKRRRKRSHMTKTDACAGTTEISSGDARSDTDKSIATAVIRDLKMPQCSHTSIQSNNEAVSNSKFKYAATQDSRDNILSDKECGCTQTPETEHPLPYLVISEKPKLSRFQCFVQRIFGIRFDRSYKNYMHPDGHIYAASDNNIIHNFCEKRRRRGFRFRRLKKPKKIQSECTLRDVKNPILSYVQTVQRSCLMNTTPRQCPIIGCRLILYGIMNYNDHLNLCHFPERKFICHYCHEGFENEFDKFVHENEHIGINKLNSNLSTPTTRPSSKKASNTQTDPPKSVVPEDKLKKIVSFFDKIGNPDHMLSGIKKNRYSESNLHTTLPSITVTLDTTRDSSTDSEKRKGNYANAHRKMDKTNSSSIITDDTTSTFSTPVKCGICGEKFKYRRQLSMHVDLEHRVYDKFSKFHSCAGILSTPTRTRTISENGRINIESIDGTFSGIRRNSSSIVTQDTYSEISRRKSEESLSCDPSTNIVYYTSMESVKKSSAINSLVEKKVRNNIGYKWEPGTKIIRV